MRARAVETVNETREALPNLAIIRAVRTVYVYRQGRGPKLEKRALAAVLRRRAKKNAARETLAAYHDAGT